jgi:hypothetical protein
MGPSRTKRSMLQVPHVASRRVFVDRWPKRNAREEEGAREQERGEGRGDEAGPDAGAEEERPQQHV